MLRPPVCQVRGSRRFATTLVYYNTLPTWDWLAAKGITPSNSISYTLYDVQVAQVDAFGAVPFVRCAGPSFNETLAGANSTNNGYTELSEVWYYYHTLGRVQSVHMQGVRVNTNNTGGRVTNCATSPGALKYYKRTLGSEV